MCKRGKNLLSIWTRIKLFRLPPASSAPPDLLPKGCIIQGRTHNFLQQVESCSRMCLTITPSAGKTLPSCSVPAFLSPAGGIGVLSQIHFSNSHWGQAEDRRAWQTSSWRSRLLLQPDMYAVNQLMINAWVRVQGKHVTWHESVFPAVCK